MTLRICSNETLGAAFCSAASLTRNSSRYSSATSPVSSTESIWPSFIAAPFIVPRTVTSWLTVSAWRFSSARRPPSSPRATLAARVPA